MFVFWGIFGVIAKSFAGNDGKLANETIKDTINIRTFR